MSKKRKIYYTILIIIDLACIVLDTIARKWWLVVILALAVALLVSAMIRSR